MKLRDHPLMTYHGMRMWPPIWVWSGGKHDKPIEGEAGILREVRIPTVPSNDRVLLIIDYDGGDYRSCLQFDDPAACQRVYELIKTCCGSSIQQIGDLEIGDTL
jgi:hypothetical protein